VKRAALLLLLLISLWATALADPEVYSVDPDGDGWPEWTSDVFPGRLFPAPGFVIVELSQQRSTDWLLDKAQQYPGSSLVQETLARRLWADERREESLLAWQRAESAAGGDLHLESAHAFYRMKQWGKAFYSLAEAEPEMFALCSEALAQHPITARLSQSGWQPKEGTSGLHKNGAVLSLEPVDALGSEPIKLGVHDALLNRDQRCLVIGEIGLQLRVESAEELDVLTADLAGPEGLAQELGRSVEGRPIVGYRFGSGNEVVMFLGAFHGDEPESSLLLEKFLAHLRERPELLEGRTAVIVPAVNPDGLSRGQRVNSNGVDLNRNYPTSNWKSEEKGTNYWAGERPGSEPETRVVVDLLSRFRPQRIVSIHCPYRCLNFDGPAQSLAEAMAVESGYKVEPSIGYPTPGSFGTYAGIEAQIPTITLELPPTGEEDVWSSNKGALVRALLGVTSSTQR